MSRGRLVTRRLESAIQGESCPICLSHVAERRAAVLSSCFHAYCVGCIERWSTVKRKCPLCNADFDSWFFGIDLGSRSFRKWQLPKEREECTRRLGNRPRHRPLAVQRDARRRSEELNISNQRSRPLPRRRWFGTPGTQSPDAISQRVLLWRKSIYEQRLQAVPHSCRSNLESNPRGNNGVKERISRRIEPWIRRELQAILEDPDPSIIVHVASSLFFSSLDAPSNQSVLEVNHLQPLRPFLHGLTNMFWHELKCFAGSPFNMETYDSVVEYRKMRE